MAKGIEWNERYNIGVEEIDRAHQRLFKIVNKLIVFNEDEKKSRWACMEGIKYFKSYAIKHFEQEEAYMKFTNYSGYERHKRIHADLRDKTLPALERELAESEYSTEAIQHFLGICIGWLSGHILAEDHAIISKEVQKWQYDTSEELPILEKAIIKVLHDVFVLDAELISEHYTGTAVGKWLCYRMLYQNKKGEKVQIILVFEAQLVTHTVGKLLNLQFKKIDRMAVDAIKLLSQQILKRIGVYLKPAERYTLEKDNIMTGEQLQQGLPKVKPQYRMLFDTGEGHFAVFIKKPIERPKKTV